MQGGEPTVALVEGSRRLPPLLCVACVAGPREDEAADAIIEAVAGAYGDPAPAALTTRLVQTVRAAHRVLLAANAQAARGDRAEAALVCLAQRGDRMYLAHAGPATCYLTRDDAPQPERLAPLVPAATTLPIGLRGDAEVGLASVELAAGGVVAVAAGPLAPRLGDDGWAWLLKRADPDAVQERLATMTSAASVPDMTLALVAPAHRSFAGDRAPALPGQPRKVAARTSGAQQVRHPAPQRLSEPTIAESATLPAHHSRTVAAGALFATLALVVAAALLLWGIDGRVPVLPEATPLAMLAGAPTQERGESLRALSARGMAFDPSADAAGRPTRTQATPTIHIGGLRDIVHVPNGVLTDLAILDRTLIVVEGSQGRILKYLLDPFGPALQADVLWQVGERRGTIVLGRPTHAVPLAAERSAAGEMVVATDDGGLWLLAQSALSMLPPLPAQARVARLAVTPQHIVALSRQPGAVWALPRQATEQGWQRWFDVDGVRDLTADGSVYLLHDDGRLTRRDESGVLPFPALVPGEPLYAPRAIATQAQSRGVYVLEPSRQRVVEFAKDGLFRRQFRYSADNAPADLRLLAHDERRGWLVLASAERAYIAPLPR